MSSILNLAYLDLLADGDDHFKQEIFASFLEHFPVMINSLEVAFKDQNADEMKHAAHKAKSPVKFLGLDALWEELNYLEESIRENGVIPNDASTILPSILSVSALAIEEVKQLIIKPN